MVDKALIETDYKTVVNGGEVKRKGSSHNWNINCDCDRDAPLSEYRDVVVEFNDMIYYFYHSTPVVVAISPNEYRVSTGGWKTKSTKERISQYLPSGYKVKQKDFNWFINGPTGETEFSDGMVVDTS